MSLPVPLVDKSEEVIPTNTVVLSGTEIWACGWIENDSQYERDWAVFGKSFVDQMVRLDLKFSPGEYPKSVDNDRKETGTQGKIVIMTNHDKTYIYGNYLDPKAKAPHHWVTMGEVRLPAGAGEITDYKSSESNQVACDSNGWVWFSPGPFPDGEGKNILIREASKTFLRFENSRNAQKVILYETIGFALDHKGRAFSFYLKKHAQPFLFGRPKDEGPYARVRGIPKNVWIVNMGMNEETAYFLDNRGEIWMTGGTVAAQEDFHDEGEDGPNPQDEFYQFYSQDSTASKWPLDGASMRDADGRLNAEEIYISQRLCFLRKTNGEWWSWNTQDDCNEHGPRATPRKEPQFFKCKLIYHGWDYALFALPPGDDPSEMEQEEGVGVVAVGWNSSGNLGIPGLQEEEQIWEARTVPNFKYKPPYVPPRPKSAQSRPSFRGDLAPEPPTKRARASQIACSICPERATRTCNDCRKYVYCCPWCASFHWRILNHHSICPRFY